MKKLFLAVLSACIGVTGGNFLYEALTTHQWGVALKNSYFMILGGLIMLFVLYLNFKEKFREQNDNHPKT